MRIGIVAVPCLLLGLLPAACGHPPRAPEVSRIGLWRIEDDPETKREAYFDGALRVLARRGFVVGTAERPSVLNTEWQSIPSGVVIEDVTVALQFRVQMTTTTQSARLQVMVASCSIPNCADFTGTFNPQLVPFINQQISGIHRECVDEAVAIYRSRTE